MGTNHICGMADRLRCCQLRWTVSVVNWWQSLPSVYHTDYWHLCTTDCALGTALCGSVIGSKDLFINSRLLIKYVQIFFSDHGTSSEFMSVAWDRYGLSKTNNPSINFAEGNFNTQFVWFVYAEYSSLSCCVLILWYGGGVGHTTEDNSSILSLNPNVLVAVSSGLLAVRLSNPVQY